MVGIPSCTYIWIWARRSHLRLSELCCCATNSSVSPWKLLPSLNYGTIFQWASLSTCNTSTRLPHQISMLIHQWDAECESWEPALFIDSICIVELQNAVHFPCFFCKTLSSLCSSLLPPARRQRWRRRSCASSTGPIASTSGANSSQRPPLEKMYWLLLSAYGTGLLSY